MFLDDKDDDKRRRTVSRKKEREKMDTVERGAIRKEEDGYAGLKDGEAGGKEDIKDVEKVGGGDANGEDMMGEFRISTPHLLRYIIMSTR